MAFIATEPFRFLDLPKDLRLMVYERLPIKTRHIIFYDPFYDSDAEDKTLEFKSKIILVKKSVPVAILATCQFVYSEARSILTPRLRELRKEPTRFIIDMSSLDLFLGDFYQTPGILRQALSIARDGNKPKKGDTFLGYCDRGLEGDVYDIYYQFVCQIARSVRGDYAITIVPHPVPGKGERISMGSARIPRYWFAFLVYALFGFEVDFFCLDKEDEVNVMLSVMLDPFSSRAKELQWKLGRSMECFEDVDSSFTCTVEEPSKEQWTEKWGEGDWY